jgi:hypothetical protein
MNGLLEKAKLQFAHDATVLAGIENGSVQVIPLTQGKVTVVDSEDYDWLSKWKWCSHKTRGRYYAHRGVWNNGRVVSWQMHRIILGFSTYDGNIGDHKNRNSLDNRKDNLRQASNSLNAINCKLSRRNTTGYRGVTWHKRDHIWWSQIRIDTKIHYLGSYQNPEEAAVSFDRAAVRYRGKDAMLNFPERREEYVARCV